MGGGGATERGAAAMRSPVGWALLGLVIQRPSYGYELIQRFERTYGDALELSSPSQIYTALDTLARNSLVEEFSEKPPTGGIASELLRQPKPHYRATTPGTHSYREWLVAQLHDERRRSRLFAYQLTVLPTPEALKVIDRFEHSCLAEAAGSGRAARSPGVTPNGVGSMAERLVREQERLTVQARLAWIAFARRELSSTAPTR